MFILRQHRNSVDEAKTAATRLLSSEVAQHALLDDLLASAPLHYHIMSLGGSWFVFGWHLEDRSFQGRAFLHVIKIIQTCAITLDTWAEEALYSDQL
jgi:hypothetical protein